jgi:excisionase family DNA binding protein
MARSERSLTTVRRQRVSDPSALAEQVAGLVIARLETKLELLAPRQLYSVSQAAAQLSVSQETIWRLLATGELGSMTVGRRRLIPAHALAAFVEAAA